MGVVGVFLVNTHALSTHHTNNFTVGVISMLGVCVHAVVVAGGQRQHTLNTSCDYYSGLLLPDRLFHHFKRHQFTPCVLNISLTSS